MDKISHKVVFLLVMLAISLNLSQTEAASSEKRLDKTLILHDMTLLAESQPDAVKVTKYRTKDGQEGKTVQPINPMAMGFVLNWSYTGTYVLTAGVTADTPYLTVRFGFNQPESTKFQEVALAGEISELREIYLGKFENKTGDLRIRIETPKSGKIAYLKIAPYSKPEWPDSRIKSNKRVLIDNDGFSVFYMNMFGDANEMANYTEKYRGTDIQGVVWCVGSILEVNYKSAYAPLQFNGVTDFPRLGDKRIHDSIRRYVNAGEDALDASIRICHENDLICLASLRMNQAPNPVYDEGRAVDLYEKFKDLRIYDTPAKRGKYLCYANAELQKHVLSIIEEIAEHEPDGLLLEFTRVPPYVGFHPDLVQKFRQVYRIPEDETINSSDPRWLKIKSEPLTQLMREVRKISVKHQEKTGKKLEIAVHIFHNRLLEESAIDVETWIDEGLVDTLIVSSKLAYMKLTPWSIPDFAKRAQKKGIPLYCQIDSHYSGHDPTPEEERAKARGEKVDSGARNVTEDYYRKTAYNFYNEGADGVLIWDGFFNLDAVTELGDRDQLYEWYEFELPTKVHSEKIVIK